MAFYIIRDGYYRNKEKQVESVISQDPFEEEVFENIGDIGRQNKNNTEQASPQTGTTFVLPKQTWDTEHDWGLFNEKLPNKWRIMRNQKGLRKRYEIKRAFVI